jgi:phenylalanyl-tRNA synthetase alpha subunit
MHQEGRSMAVVPEFSNKEDGEGTPVATKVVKRVVKKAPKKVAKKTAPPKKTVSKPVAKKAAPKKATVKRAAPVKATKTAPKKTAAKKVTAAKPAKTKTQEKNARSYKAKKAAGKIKSTMTQELNVYGFKIGSDSALIVDELIKGGKGRADVTARIEKKLPVKTTRNGEAKNVPSLIAGLLSRLREQGYKVEQTWKITPPAAIQRKALKAAEAPKTVRKASK